MIKKGKMTNLFNVGRKSPEGELPVLRGFLDLLYLRSLSSVVLIRETDVSELLRLEARLLKSSKHRIKSQSNQLLKRGTTGIHTASRGPIGGASREMNSS